MSCICSCSEGVTTFRVAGSGSGGYLLLLGFHLLDITFLCNYCFRFCRERDYIYTHKHTHTHIYIYVKKCSKTNIVEEMTDKEYATGHPRTHPFLTWLLLLLDKQTDASGERTDFYGLQYFLQSYLALFPVAAWHPKATRLPSKTMRHPGPIVDLRLLFPMGRVCMSSL